MTKFTSRKFIVTMSALVGSILLAYLGKMDGNTAIVLGACVGAYNYANAKIEEFRSDS